MRSWKLLKKNIFVLNFQIFLKSILDLWISAVLNDVDNIIARHRRTEKCT